jgi:hypothetical protein
MTNGLMRVDITPNKHFLAVGAVSAIYMVVIIIIGATGK